MKLLSWPLLAMGGLLLAACATVPDLPPAPHEPALSGREVLPPYRIQVGDTLDLRMLLNPELNETVTVRPDGFISTTVVSNVRAAGDTVPELAAVLKQDYTKYLKEPMLTVELKSFAPSRFYVGGEVNTPGEFITVGPDLTLSQAIARAGGVKLSADDAKIFVIRRTGPNDTVAFLGTDWSDVEHGRDPQADIRLAPGDVVYAPKTGIAEVYKWYNQYIQQFANPNFGFSYIINNAAAAVVPVSH